MQTQGTQADSEAGPITQRRRFESGPCYQPLVYLASPYSHPDKAVEWMRYIQAARAAAHLTRNGVFVYSPIAHSHPLAVHGGLSGSWDFWQRVARQWVERCDRLVVLKLDGWLESVGVQAEIEHARSLGKPVEYLEP